MAVVEVSSSKESTPVSPVLESSGSNGSGTAKFGPLSLLNALSACVMSARLRAEYRQWSLQQVVSGLTSLGCRSSAIVECAVDTAGDLPSCPVAKLEAHQNRVTSCVFHQRKGLLATRFDSHCVWNMWSFLLKVSK